MIAAAYQNISSKLSRIVEKNNREKYLKPGTRLYMIADEFGDIEFEVFRR